jgi:hypothetical protein
MLLKQDSKFFVYSLQKYRFLKSIVVAGYLRSFLANERFIVIVCSFPFSLFPWYVVR